MQRFFASLLLALLVGTFGCGLADKAEEEAEEQTTVTHEVEIPIEFTIDGDALCEQSASEHNYDCEKKPMGSPMNEHDLGKLELEQNVDIVEASGEPKLQEASGRFEKITISKIEYEYTQHANNPLSFSTPELDILMSALEAKKGNYDTEFSDQTVLLTTLPSVPAGENDSGTADVSDQAESQASPLFKKLKFSEISRGNPTVGTDDKVPPGGKVDVKMTMFVKFVANAVDAAGG